MCTDAQLHSVRNDGSFGAGDLGEAGILSYFRNHTCGEICKALGLPPHKLHPPATATATASASGGSGGAKPSPAHGLSVVFSADFLCSCGAVFTDRSPDLLAVRVKGQDTPCADCKLARKWVSVDCAGGCGSKVLFDPFLALLKNLPRGEKEQFCSKRLCQAKSTAANRSTNLYSLTPVFGTPKPASSK